MKSRTRMVPLWFLISFSCVFLNPPVARAVVGDENWDSNFGIPGTLGPGVYAISISEGEVYLGGAFSSIEGTNASNIARWDRTRWHPLGTGLNGAVSSLFTSGNEVYAGGSFTQAGEVVATNVARWDGTNWSALSVGINGNVSALAGMGYHLFVGGSFSSAGGLAISNIAQWDGTNWSSLSGGINGPVSALLVHGNALYVGGSFSQAGGAAAANIARWDGTNWLALGQGLPASASALAASSSAVYAYSTLRSSPPGGFTISKWDGTNLVIVAEGQLEAPCFDCDASTGGMAISGNDIYIGGAFSYVLGELWEFDRTRANSVAKWDGTRNIWGGVNWVALGSGINSFPAGSVALATTGSELFIGGGFSHVGGKPSLRIALWHIPHSLSTKRSGNMLTLSWPATGSNFVLESKTNLNLTNWNSVPQPPAVVGDQLVVTNSILPTNQFFRLRRR